MNIHKKIGPFPVWAWGVAITGGIVLGIYLRRRAASSAQATVDPNAALDALTNSTGFGVADPNSGLDSGGIISGLMQQQSDLLSFLLATAGGGGSVPAIGDPVTYSPQASTPTSTSTATSSGAAPVAAVAPINEPTYSTPAPAPAPADPQYPLSTYQSPTVIDTGTTSAGLPVLETQALAMNPDSFMSAARSSTGGVGGTGYLLLSDKTLAARPGVTVMM